MPKHKVVVRKNLLIQLRDGVELAADLYRPVARGNYPTIVQYFPYRKDDFIRDYAEKILGYFAAHGYAGLEIDVRGTGNSGGHTGREMTLQQAQDGYEAIEWAARQGWSDGRVGMTGVSYGGWTSYGVAAQKPPHLKAIVPIYIGDDHYQNHYPGGSFGGYLYVLYNSYMLAYCSAPPAYRDKEGRWKRVWREHLEKTEPWLFSWLENQTEDSHVWREASFRQRYADIEVPTFVIGGWRDLFPSAARFYAGLSCPKKLLMGPWMHITPDVATPGPRVDYRRGILRWFEYWLRGVDTGIMSEPPVTIYMQTYDHPSPGLRTISGRWRFEREWPPKRAKHEDYYLHAEGRLKSTRPSAPAGKTTYVTDSTTGLQSSASSLTGFGLGFGLPLDQRPDEQNSAVFTSEPFRRDIEVTGEPRVTLFVSSDSKQTAFVTKLCDVAPDGTSVLVSKGYLNGTHRESHSRPQPLIPGKVYEIEVDMNATSYLFQKEHSMRLDVNSVDFPCVWPPSSRAENAIFHSRSRSSRITLPIVPPRREPPKEPALEPATTPLPHMKPPSWTVTRDYSSSRASVALSFEGETVVNRLSKSSYECSVTAQTSTLNPADTTMEGRIKVFIDSSDINAMVTAVTSVRSTSDRFHVRTSVRTDVNGGPHKNRSWKRSFVRKLL